MQVQSSQAAYGALASSPRSVPARIRILLAEDDDEMRQLMARTLRREGYEVVECCDGFQLFERLGTYALPSAFEEYDVIISDIQMPRFDGLEVLEGVERRDGIPQLIVISAFADAWSRKQAARSGAAAFLDKPFAMSELVTTVRELLPIAPRRKTAAEDEPAAASPRRRQRNHPVAVGAAPRRRVLLAEDDREMRTLLVMALRRAGYDVFECRDGIELLHRIEDRDSASSLTDFDIIVSDVCMPGVTGISLLEGLQQWEELAPLRMILITAFADDEMRERAHRLGAVEIFDKPFELEDLVAKVREIVP